VDSAALAIGQLLGRTFEVCYGAAAGCERSTLLTALLLVAVAALHWQIDRRHVFRHEEIVAQIEGLRKRLEDSHLAQQTGSPGHC
jgi:hypothetical protein